MAAAPLDRQKYTSVSFCTVKHRCVRLQYTKGLVSYGSDRFNSTCDGSFYYYSHPRGGYIHLETTSLQPQIRATMQIC